MMFKKEINKVTKHMQEGINETNMRSWADGIKSFYIRQKEWKEKKINKTALMKARDQEKT